MSIILASWNIVFGALGMFGAYKAATEDDEQISLLALGFFIGSFLLGCLTLLYV